MGNINLEKKEVAQKKMYQSYDTISRSKGSCPEALENFIYMKNKYLCGLFNNDSTLIRNKDVGYKAWNIFKEKLEESNPEYHRIGIVPCVYATTNEPMCYVVGDSQYPLPCESIRFWFYPTK